MVFDDVLKKVDAVNWSELRTTGYVQASKEIPKMFRDILSDNLQTRKGTYEDLWWHLNGEYMVATASPVVIPFLVELLTIEETPNKDEILFLLGDILMYPISEPWDNEPEWVTRMRPIRIKIAEEVWKGLEIYIQLLEESDELIQIFAAGLLFEGKRFPEEHESRLKNLYTDLKSRILAKEDPNLLKEFEFEHWDKHWLNSETNEETEQLADNQDDT